MAETVDTHAVDLKIVCGDTLTIRSDLRLILGLEDRDVRTARSGGVWQTGSTSVWIASCVTEHSGREPCQLVRIAARLWQSLDLGGCDCLVDICVLGFELLCGFVGNRNHGCNLADLQNDIDALHIFSVDRDVFGN